MIGFYRTLSSSSPQCVPPGHLWSFSRLVFNLTTLHLILIFYAPSNNTGKVIKKKHHAGEFMEVFLLQKLYCFGATD